MARRRDIDPSIWRHPKIAELPLETVLLYVGMFSMADDAGRLQADPRAIKADLFALRDDVTAKQVTGWRDELISAGLVCQYSADYVHFPNWHRWQGATSVYVSKLPACPDHPWCSHLRAEWIEHEKSLGHPVNVQRSSGEHPVSAHRSSGKHPSGALTESDTESEAEAEAESRSRKTETESKSARVRASASARKAPTPSARPMWTIEKMVDEVCIVSDNEQDAAYVNKTVRGWPNETSFKVAKLLQECDRLPERAVDGETVSERLASLVAEAERFAA